MFQVTISRLNLFKTMNLQRVSPQRLPKNQQYLDNNGFTQPIACELSPIRTVIGQQTDPKAKTLSAFRHRKGKLLTAPQLRANIPLFILKSAVINQQPSQPDTPSQSHALCLFCASVWTCNFLCLLFIFFKRPRVRKVLGFWGVSVVLF